MGRTVKVVYHADTLQTEITVDGEPFDTSRINGKGIEDWAYPFMMRKVKWGGFYEEMVEALNGEKAFNLIFEGSKEALAELQEAWEDAPVTIVEETAEPTVEIEYDADALTTSITVNGEPFDTTRINGREIEDWVYPFMMRKIKWDGIFKELTKFIGSESYHISFTGEEKWLSALEEECPETVTISGKSKQETIDFAYISFNNNGFSISDKAFQEYYANMDHGMMTQHLSNEITNAMHQLIQNDSFSVSIQSITDVSGVMATDSICIANSIKQVIDCISKIYDSWDSPRANIYRSSNGIPWNQGFAIEISLSGRNNDKNSLANQENKSAKELYEMAGACEDDEKALENLNDSELEIDINDPMDTTYDLDQHNNFQATFIHHSENIEIYDDEEKNFVYSLFVFITPEYSKKIISILDASSNIFTDKSEYDSVSSCYNDLAKCYDIDYSEETEFKRVQNARKIVDRIYSYKKRNVMKWILKEISEGIPLMRSYDLDLDMDKIRNAGNVLSASNDKLKVLISEINNNFKKNKDKIFTYFYEIDNAIIHFMFYKVYRTQIHFNNAYSEYLDADASILNSISDFISGNDTTEEWERQLKKHIDTAKSTIYISAIINALYYIYNDAMNAITENLNENNNFFDEI